MSFKRSNMDEDTSAQDNDEVQLKRPRGDNESGGFRGNRGRGRGRGDRGFRGRGNNRGRGGFNKFNRDNEDGNDDNDDNERPRGRGGFRGRSRGGGGRFQRGGRGNRGNFRGRGRGRGGGQGDFNSRPNFQRESKIKVGQEAPSFENVLNEKSESISLKQFQGKYVVLFIYYKDGTFGCTTEQKSFNNVKDDFDKHNAVILGVSKDDVASHKAAIEENALKYSLLSDPDGKINESYGTIDEDSNRVYRSTFLISPEGKISAVWTKFEFEKHGKDVLTKLEGIISGKVEISEDTKRDEENGENEDDENAENDDDDENDNDVDDDEQEVEAEDNEENEQDDDDDDE